MSVGGYQKLTVRRGDHFFSLFCTRDSWNHRRDELMQWVDQLAGKLRFKNYVTQISDATEAEATERPYALFEHLFPTKAAFQSAVATG